MEQSLLVDQLPWRYWHITPLILFNFIHVLVKVDLLWLQPSRFLEQFPPEEQDREDENHHVAEQKGRNVPSIENENRIASDKSHDEAAGERVPSTKWLPPRLVRKRVAREPLSLTSIFEFDKGESHDSEVDQLRGGYLKRSEDPRCLTSGTYQADKPAQNDGCTVADL